LQPRDHSRLMPGEAVELSGIEPLSETLV